MNPDALDRYITGNYGEDQFKAWEDQATSLYMDTQDALRTYVSHVIGDDPEDQHLIQDVMDQLSEYILKVTEDFT